MNWLEDLPPKVKKKRYQRMDKYGTPCLGYWGGNPSDGYDFDCKYENSGGITCDNCICTGGEMNPITGKRVYKKGDNA